MMRRKIKDCCGDPCGNKVRKVNGISPDPNGEFSIEAGSGVGITQIENGIVIDASAASGVLTVDGVAPDQEGNLELKTVGGNELVGSGDVGFKTINSSSIVGSGDIALQTPLTAGTDYATPAQVSTAVSDKVVGSGDIGNDLRPIKIVNGQAVAVGNDLVDVSSAQTITGVKTISTSAADSLIVQGNDKNITFKSNYPLNRSSVGTFGNFVFRHSNSNKNACGIYFYNTATEDILRLRVRNLDPNDSEIQLSEMSLQASATEKWSSTDYRTYNSSHQYDIVTIGSLANNPNVIHSIGNEDIRGVKKLYGSALRPINPGVIGQSSTTYNPFMVFADANNTGIGYFDFIINSDGTSSFAVMVKNSDGSNKVVFLAKGDVV